MIECYMLRRQCYASIAYLQDTVRNFVEAEALANTVTEDIIPYCIFRETNLQTLLQ